jgi:hypothetical protein
MVQRRRRRSRLSRWWRTRLRYLRAEPRLRGWLLLGIGGLAGLTIGWIVVTGILARNEISDLNSQLSEVRVLVSEGKISQASDAAAGIPGLAKRAHLLTTGPAWWAASHVPYFGRPVHVVRGATAAGKQVGVDGVQTLLHVATSLDPQNLRHDGNTVQLAPLTAAAPALAKAAAALDSALAHLDRLPNHTWLGSVDNARRNFSNQLHSVVGYVDAAANATRVLPSMMGSSGTKRYFIGLQNEAEMRGTGGLPGAFAVATVTAGKVTFTHFFTDAMLLPAATKQQVPTGLDFGKGYDAAYGPSAPTSLIVNSNLSPNFPYAAQIWATMWEKVSGEHVDGAIALDPTSLAYFLAVTGPVTLPSGITVTADNIVEFTEKDEYALIQNNDARKQFLVSILQAVSKKLISGAGSAQTLAQTIASLAAQQHIAVWSADPRAQAVLAATSYGGAIPPANRPLAAMALNNIAGGKLDYYLTRTISYRRTGCGPSRDVFVTITLTNTAPASGLPAYVTSRLDTATSGPVQPGDNRTQLDYYATGGALLLSATLNGKPTTIAVYDDLGHPIFRDDLELPRGTTQTLTLHLIEPKGVGTPLLWKQPGVTPLVTEYYNQPC